MKEVLTFLREAEAGAVVCSLGAFLVFWTVTLSAVVVAIHGWPR